MRLSILALDGVFDTGLAALLDTLGTANELAAAQGSTAAPFDFNLVGVRRRVRTALGFSTQPEPVAHVRQPDWVVLPALNAKQPESLLAALARPDVRETIGHLRGWHAQGIGIAAACTGTFVLAEAGLLDHGMATTTWSLAPAFRQRFPAVDLDDSRMVVASRRVVTAGSAMGHLDLALWLVRQASPELATMVARFLLIDQRASQAHYIVPDYVAHADPLIARFERWSREHLSAGFSLNDAASALCVGPRTLQRRTEAVLGKSPLAFFQDLRIERARQLLSAGCDLEKIASEVGYADSATLRTLLRRKLGHGVREMRADRR
ncbi:helix-turn-helix domain-containing protein [Caballeronia sp. LZ034LL]|uniref:GlxA family transcriptional regulator n=1 Tax=Caballeronia sp. LZ034LL TaxID=3038567 RepID=UPI0028549EB7|nr:helix-turn-helix domain-containing protein [Caballeronia sp. LZ034LL]MDR5836639.1 helix-turn-helix domain-containing protein [Caballeronia sp. LZ034LL]